MKLAEGDRVRHAVKTEWGIGEVLADEAGGKVRIFFEDVGAKEFVVSGAALQRLTGEEASSDYLTALVKWHRKSLAAASAPGTARSGSAARKPAAFLSFPAAVQKFLTHFPQGFEDPAYLAEDGERHWKVDAGRRMVEWLDEPMFRDLLAQRSFDEICARAKRVVNRTSLISAYEKIWLNDALRTAEGREAFAASLFDLLYGADFFGARFERFADTLGRLHAAKWPIATYFPFVRFPDKHMFVKPTVTQEAAKVLNLDLHYRPEVNALTYRKTLELANELRRKLGAHGLPEMAPKDLIDVQAFVWVTAPGYG